MKPQRTPLFSVTIGDCLIQTFRSGGKGGQHQNKTESGVRIIHPPSGARGESREFRSQLENKRAAFGRMGATLEFQKWVKAKAAKLRGVKTLDERVEEAMAPGNLKVERLTEEGWKPFTEEGEYNE
jgi:protein subunit release factor B